MERGVKCPRGGIREMTQTLEPARRILLRQTAKKKKKEENFPCRATLSVILSVEKQNSGLPWENGKPVKMPSFRSISISKLIQPGVWQIDTSLFMPTLGHPKHGLEYFIRTVPIKDKMEMIFSRVKLANISDT